MLFKRNPNGIDLPFPSEITPRAVFEARRDFIKQAAVGAIAGPGILLAGEAGAQALAKLPATPNAHLSYPTSTPISSTPAPTTTSTSSAPTRTSPRRTPGRCARVPGPCRSRAKC
jgi:hypothetical protein